MIVTAADEKDEAKRVATEKAISTFGVNCIVCHNTKVSVERILQGEPRPGVFYGPTGKPSSVYGTEKTKALSSALFCGQYHSIYNPPDNDVIFCNTLYDSYLNAHIPGGGQKTCQECHRPASCRTGPHPDGGTHARVSMWK